MGVKEKGGGKILQEPLITNSLASASFDMQQQHKAEDIQFAVRQWPRTIPPTPSAIELGELTRTSPMPPLSRKTISTNVTTEPPPARWVPYDPAETLNPPKGDILPDPRQK